MNRRYAIEGDTKPRQFIIDDMFTYKNGETAVVIEVFDRYEGKGKYGPEWTLRLLWTPGKDGDTMNREADYPSPKWGALATNMFNNLSIRRGVFLFPAVK